MLSTMPASSESTSAVNPACDSPRILTIGAVAQGHTYSEPIARLYQGQVVAVCEPIPFNGAESGGKNTFWKLNGLLPHEEFEDWKDVIAYELSPRERVKAGEMKAQDEGFKGVKLLMQCS